MMVKNGLCRIAAAASASAIVIVCVMNLLVPLKFLMTDDLNLVRLYTKVTRQNTPLPLLYFVFCVVVVISPHTCTSMTVTDTYSTVHKHAQIVGSVSVLCLYCIVFSSASGTGTGTTTLLILLAAADATSISSAKRDEWNEYQ